MNPDVPFSDLFELPLRNGVSYASSLRGSGIPMVNMKEIFAYDRISDQECELAPLTAKEKESFLLQGGDLLFARQSLTFEGAGKVSLVLDSSQQRTWESHLIRVRLNLAKASPQFYYYYFRSPVGRSSIETIVQQVAAAGIRGSDLARLPVPLPPLDEQHAVAEVLGALDDKIAANAKLAGTCEELMRCHFDRLQLIGDTLEGASPASDLVHFNPKTPAPAEDVPVYVDMQKLPTGSMSIPAWDHRGAKGGARFQNGDTLLARITPCLENRKTGYVDFLAEGQVGLGSTEYIVMRPRTGVPNALPYFLATNGKFRRYAIQHMVGTSGRQRVAARDIEGFPVATPTQIDLAAFDEITTPVLALIQNLTAENRTLAATRDAVLPQLMSGKLRVMDAESLVTEAV